MLPCLHTVYIYLQVEVIDLSPQYTMEWADEYEEKTNAIIDSCVSRARPVSLAAATTVLGMIPLLPDVFFSGMAITIMSGLTFATALTLVFVPVLYAIFFKVPNKSI